MIITDRYNEALSYAETLHRSQFRKGTSIPYISHLMTVSALVLEHGGDEDQAIAGLLHDAVEDQGGETTLANIKTRFGGSVAVIVADCTDSWEEPKPEWRPRKEAYIEGLFKNHRHLFWFRWRTKRTTPRRFFMIITRLVMTSGRALPAARMERTGITGRLETVLPHSCRADFNSAWLTQLIGLSNETNASISQHLCGSEGRQFLKRDATKYFARIRSSSRSQLPNRQSG